MTFFTHLHQNWMPPQLDDRGGRTLVTPLHPIFQPRLVRVTIANEFRRAL